MLEFLRRLPRQLAFVSPFGGDSRPSRVPLFLPGSGRPTLPFPHPWNYDQPIRILEACFWGADRVPGPGRNNRYLEIPGLAPFLFTRDPGMIRAIETETGEREGQFDRDPLPSRGIARATGPDTLLYANGPQWKSQRKASASPFGKTALFRPEIFHEFAESFRQTVRKRLAALHQRLEMTGQTTIRVALEPDIKAVMLEMLTNCFFGAEIPYDEIRTKFVPALERIIDRIVRDTAMRAWKLATFQRRNPLVQQDEAIYAELTEIVLSTRPQNKGLWKQFKSDAPDDALRSNIKVFLAGALEATTSFASWGLAHLSRNLAAQEKVFADVKDINEYTPDNLPRAQYLGYVFEETLRLTQSLYFLPRKATADTWVETADGRKMFIPKGTHMLLDIWHANRDERNWGVEVTGYPASDFVPERWQRIAELGRGSKEFLHFGFGHGPRVC